MNTTVGNDTSVPAITVITPAYNAERYIQESIESILNQTFQRFEYIIIDNASTDGTWDTIQACAKKDSRIIAHRNESNLGIAGNRNKALAMAKGTFIAWQDADDISLPDRLDQQYDFLTSHPEIFLLGGGYAPFNEHGHRVNIFHPTSSLEIAWRFLTNMFFANPTIMFRREILDAVGLMPDTGAEDYAFLSKVVQQYRCANLKRILIRYREHETNYSTTAQSNILETIRKISKENFLHYIGQLEGAEIFYRYQAQRRMALKNLPRVNHINQVILRKIAQQYGISRLSIPFFRMKLLFFVSYIWAVFGSFKDAMTANFLKGPTS